MTRVSLPFPVLDALPSGAHRLIALTDEALFEASGVHIMFTGRAGGVSEGPYASLNTASHVGDDSAAVEQNRRRVLEITGASHAELIVLNQVHGTDLVQVEEELDIADAVQRGRDGADGIVVGTAGVAALLNFADCLPVIVVSPSGRFAVAHAGWRGAVAGIAGKAARSLAEGDSFPASEFNAYIGPHIRTECFEVGEDVASRFVQAFGPEVVEGSRHVSLAHAVSCDLTRAGLDPQRIADASICTKCHADEYFSYRATGGTCGRHAAFAVRLDNGDGGCCQPEEPQVY